mgnify:CR=1 FL=1
MCISRYRRQRGLSLIELVMFIVIVSVALAGVLTVLNVTVKGSADPMISKQMLAIAEALLEEVQLQPFTWCDPDDPAAAAATGYGSCATPQNTIASKSGETRGSNTAPFDNVFDYNGETITSAISGGAMPAVYSATIAVTPEALNGVGDATTTSASLRIAVTVNHGGDSIVLEGYRARYAPKLLP